VASLFLGGSSICASGLQGGVGRGCRDSGWAWRSAAHMAGAARQQGATHGNRRTAGGGASGCGAWCWWQRTGARLQATVVGQGARGLGGEGREGGAGCRRRDAAVQDAQGGRRRPRGGDAAQQQGARGG
jgi:hypothetical protein